MADMFVIDLHSKIDPETALFLLSPRPGDNLVFITDPQEATCENLAALAGCFPSKTEARKAGFEGPLPHGVELLGIVGRTFWVWNPEPTTCKLGKKRIWTNIWFDLALKAGTLIGPQGEPWPVLYGNRRISF